MRFQGKLLILRGRQYAPQGPRMHNKSNWGEGETHVISNEGIRDREELHADLQSKKRTKYSISNAAEPPNIFIAHFRQPQSTAFDYILNNGNTIRRGVVTALCIVASLIKI